MDKTIKSLLLFLLLLTFSLSAAAETCSWSSLIGKTLVLFRFGNMENGMFTRSSFPNPAGERPMERLVLTDSTHLAWKYSGQGDFTRQCSINGSELTLSPQLFGNSHLNIVSRLGETLLTLGEDRLTRAFFILDSIPSPAALPLACNSPNGFCNGLVDDLLPMATDFTFHSATPMGRHFLFHRRVEEAQKQWLESNAEVFDSTKNITIKAFDINLFPHGKPMLADVNQKRLNDCNAVSVLADMAFLYPDFIRSIIHQESPDSFRLDMFDPEGRPIIVRVSNRFPVTEDGGPIFCVGKDKQPNWISIMEKAVMKWIRAYEHINSIEGCNAEMITPLFTGDGRSFCIQPGRLSGEDLARMINVCLEHGMMVNGGFLKSDIPLDAHTTISKHGHTFLPPQRPGALYSIRNPWGNGKDNHVMNVMPADSIVPPMIDIRIVSPGAAAKYFRTEANE